MTIHATQRTSPWGDWLNIDLAGADWYITGSATPGQRFVSGISAMAADQLDATASAASPTNVKGCSSPKLTFTRETGGSAVPIVAVMCKTVKLPSWVPSRDQSSRLADWDGNGATGNEMGDGGRRVALQIEHVFSSRNSGSVIGSDLTGFAQAVKYKGFGAALLAAIGDFPIGTQTEDAPVAPNVLATATLLTPTLATAWGIAATTSFPDLALPSDLTTPAGPNVAPTFGSNGVCRIQSIIEVPATVWQGTEIELITAIQIPIAVGGGVGAVAVQWQYSSYRWLRGGPEFSYPADIAPNSAWQLEGDGTTDEEAEQPYIDAGVDAP